MLLLSTEGGCVATQDSTQMFEKCHNAKPSAQRWHSKLDLPWPEAYLQHESWEPWSHQSLSHEEHSAAKTAHKHLESATSRAQCPKVTFQINPLILSPVGFKYSLLSFCWKKNSPDSCCVETSLNSVFKVLNEAIEEKISVEYRVSCLRNKIEHKT